MQKTIRHKKRGTKCRKNAKKQGKSRGKRKKAPSNRKVLLRPLQDTSNDTISPCAPLRDGAKTAVFVEKQQKHGATRKDLPIPRKIGGKSRLRSQKRQSVSLGRPFGVCYYPKGPECRQVCKKYNVSRETNRKKSIKGAWGALSSALRLWRRLWVLGAWGLQRNEKSGRKRRFFHISSAILCIWGLKPLFL